MCVVTHKFIAPWGSFAIYRRTPNWSLLMKKFIVVLLVIAAFATVTVRGVSVSAAKPIQDRNAQIEAILEQSK